jgi:pyruvate ferredoxin oxidoreductase beta subunit
MSLDYVKFSPGFESFMPKEYRDMVEHGPFGKKTTVSQMGNFIATVVPNNPRRVESCIKKAVLIAREVGPTYIQAYTSCNIEYAIPTDKVMEDAKTVEDDRYKFTEYVSEDAQAYLADRYGYKEFLQKPGAVTAKA